MQGLQIFDSSGNKILDVTDRLTRVLGSFETGAVDGSLTDPNLTAFSGTPWFYQYVIQSGSSWAARPCRLTCIGNTINWYYEQGYNNKSLSNFNMKIIYGVY